MPARKRIPHIPITPEAPAMIMEGHAQSTTPGRRGGWNQTTSDHLGNYAVGGQINEDQLEAARWYEETYKAREPSCETKFERVSRGGTGLPISLIQAEAMKRIIAVDTRLSQENRLIVRAICGDGHNAAHVVRQVIGESSKHYPIPRFREALNALRNAILAAKKDGWKATLERVG